MNSLQCFAVTIVFAVIELLGSTGNARAENGGHNSGLSLTLTLGKSEAYLGEAVSVTVMLQVKNSRVRNVSYPDLEIAGDRNQSFTSPEQITSPEEPDRVSYRFTTHMYPKKTGTVHIRPATVSCEVMEPAIGAAAFFGGTEPRTVSVSSNDASLLVLPIPVKTRPASFRGAVGRFHVNVTAKPDRVTVSHPLTISTVIAGNGALTAANCPDISATDVKSYPIKSSVSSTTLTCEQVIEPLSAGHLPKMEWSYFDPDKRDFVTFTVALPVVAVATKPISAEGPPILPPSPSSVAMWPVALYILGAILLLAVVAGIILFHKPANLQKSTVSLPDLSMLLENAEQALNDRDVGKFYTFVALILQEVIAEKCGIPSQGVAGVPPEWSHPENSIHVEIEQIFKHCHLNRYCRVFIPDEVVLQDYTSLCTILSALKPGRCKKNRHQSNLLARRHHIDNILKLYSL
jgi:hypothetical protein